MCGDQKQLIGTKDYRWHRFGLNIPAEPQRPVQPEDIEVTGATPGQVLVSCATVPYAKRYRFFIQKVGTTGELAAVGASSEPLFLIEHLDAGGRYNVCVSAVNLAGNEGPKPKVPWRMSSPRRRERAAPRRPESRSRREEALISFSRKV